MDDFSNVKTGDTVIVCRSGFDEIREVVKVVRATPTLIRTQFYTFRRKDGREIGEGSWGHRRPYIEAATPERIADAKLEKRRREAISAIQNVKLRDLPNETLFAIHELLSSSPQD